MFVERSTQYTSFSPRKQPANAGTECKQFTENASVALQQPILTHAYTKCPPVGLVHILLKRSEIRPAELFAFKSLTYFDDFYQ